MPGSNTGRKTGLQMTLYLAAVFVEKKKLINSFKSVLTLTEYNVDNKHMIVTRKIDNISAG